MVNLTIDGKSIEVPEGTTVLRAAQDAGIFIPTLCDHPELTPYGGCRLCLVEVEGFRTLQPSCTLPVNNNMVVRTNTPKIHEARKLVLSLIFSERNHFCPYCQVSGGDCELQNNAYLEGMTHWPIQPNWQPYEVDASNPFIVIEHNRCILCRRCVRACGELVGNYTLGFAERGAASILIADLGVPLGESTCVSCGMCVQVCPTGAIIDRSSAYLGLEKNLESAETICQGCSVGCGLKVETRNNRIVRIEGNWDAPLNQGLTCQIGRYDPLYDDRKPVETPLIRKNGQLLPATWQEAIQAAATMLKQGDSTAVASPRLSLEALNIFKQVFKGRASVIESASLPGMIDGLVEGSLSELDDADCFVILGADLKSNHQVVGFLVKRAVQTGANLIVVDTKDNPFAPLSEFAFQSGNSIATIMDGLTAGLSKLNLAKSATTVKPWDILGSIAAKTGLSSDAIVEAARVIGNAKKVAIIFGEGLIAEGAESLARLVEFARSSGSLSSEHSTLIAAVGEANSLGAHLLGLQSSQSVASTCYIALGDQQINPDLSTKLSSVKHLIVQASYQSEITESADVILPAAIWASQAGHFISLDGTMQQSQKVVSPSDQIKANDEILAMLADQLGIKLVDDWQTSIHAAKSPVAVHFN